MFKKIARWFTAHPIIKTVGMTIGTTAVTLVTNGTLGPKAAAAAAAVMGLYNLFTKRPQDAS